jgi:hypothetical protein
MRPQVQGPKLGLPGIRQSFSFQGGVRGFLVALTVPSQVGDAFGMAAL